MQALGSGLIQSTAQSTTKAENRCGGGISIAARIARGDEKRSSRKCRPIERLNEAVSIGISDEIADAEQTQKTSGARELRGYHVSSSERSADKLDLIKM